MQSLLAAACSGQALSFVEAAALLEDMPGCTAALLAAAGAATVSTGAAPFTCGIINAKSGRCPENCAFCAQSSHFATGAQTYSLVSGQALLERAEGLAAAGITYMGIVTSGASPSERDFADICEAALSIRRQTGIKLCASLGLLSTERAVALQQAGFTSYHHNLETARGYYSTICSTHPYDVRVQTVQNARNAGLRVCSGGIFGLGEGWEHRLELAQTLAELDVDSVPVNFLTPIPGTPLEGAARLEVREALLLPAILRLMLPGKDIVICGGRAHTLGTWENTLLLTGANGLMVGDYLTTRGSPFEKDLEMLRTLGRMRHEHG